MKKIRNTNSKILFALSLMFASSALGLISFGTMCAFQNKEQESFQYQTDIKPLTSYFDGGIGTLSNPYINQFIGYYIVDNSISFVTKRAECTLLEFLQNHPSLSILQKK